MKALEAHVLDMLKRVDAFGTAHAAAIPATTLGAQQFAKVHAAVSQTTQFGATQVSGAGGQKQGTRSKTACRLALHASLAAIRDGAHSLALLGAPGLDAQFRLPRSGGEQALLNCARAFAADALPLKDQFLSLGMAANFLDTLKADTDAFEAATKVQSSGTGTQAGATAGIASTEHGAVIAVHVLDTIVRNLFHADPAILAAWAAARHIEHPPTPPKPAPPAPTP